MNKLLFALIPLFVLLVACNSMDEQTEKIKAYRNDFPGFEEVISHCSKHIRGKTKEGYLGFEKKPEGYFVKITSNDQKVIAREKVWDFKTKKFLVIDFSAYMEPSEKNAIDDAMKRQEHFDFYLFYGYGDAHLDIIKLLRGGENLSLNDWEQLARAYDHKASNILRPGMWGEKPSNTKGFENTGYTRLNAKRVKDFMNSANESLKFYKKIHKKDPNYKGFIIEDIELKMANNCVHYYNMLRCVKEEAKGRKYLRKAKFPQEYMTVAKDYLKHCEKNALLFTDGDNDTFPLWYVQEMEKYRNDVIVINNSLAQTTWYWEMLKDQYELNLRSDLQSTQKNECFVVALDLDFQNDAGTNVNELLEEINQVSEEPKEDALKYVPATRLTELSINEEPVNVRMNVGYLMFHQWTLLDAIQNNPNRPVYFASPTVARGIGLANRLAYRGQTYQLVPDKVTGYLDSTSREILEGQIADFHPEKYLHVPEIYVRNLHFIAAYVANDVYEEDPERYAKIVAKIDQQLPDKKLYSEKGINHVQSKIYLKSELSAAKLQKDFEAFRAHVKSVKNGLEVTPENAAESARRLYAIFAVYQNFSMSNLGANEALQQEFGKLKEWAEEIQKSKALKDHTYSQDQFNYLLQRIESVTTSRGYNSF